MPSPLVAHTARYALLDAAGQAAGTEDLAVEWTRGAAHIRSRITGRSPFPAEVMLEWGLDARLVTSVLYVVSRDHAGVEHELEAAVSGNGMLAHRRGPDGPSQVELGWGPEAEFNHLSAAFSEVILARTWGAGLHQREITSVTLGVDDLEPVIATQRYLQVGTDADGGRQYECLTIDTGRRDRISVTAAGVLVAYEGLIQLERAEAAPTK